jgi:hypothetical protein
MKYPAGPETQKKAAKTTPGQLANLLNRLLYDGDYKTVREAGLDRDVHRWVAPDEVYKGGDAIPEGMAEVEGRESYFETESLLRAIRDYLEFRSLEEVIP